MHTHTHTHTHIEVNLLVTAVVTSHSMHVHTYTHEIELQYDPANSKRLYMVVKIHHKGNMHSHCVLIIIPQE